jgi:hypothetical protein
MKSLYIFLLTLICSGSVYSQPKQNYAQQFNGNQILQLSNTASLNLGNTFTMEAWVYLQAASPYGVIIGKTFNPRANDPFQNYVLSLDATGLKPELIQTTGTSGTYRSATATNAIALNTWVHIAGTLGGGQLKLYINGALVANTSSAGSPLSTTGVPFALGSGATPSGQTTCCGISAKMIQARVWNKANSISEIQSNKNINLQGTETGLLACWPLNDSSGQSIIDITPNANHLIRGITVNTESEDPIPVFISPYFINSTIVLPINSRIGDELYVIDYNSDLKLDLIASRLTWPATLPATYGPMQCLKNNGNMSFSNDAGIIGFDSLVHPRDFTVADFNGDQKEDLFIADHGTDVSPFPGGQNRLYLQNANGKLVESSSGNIPMITDFTHNAASADVDKDGDIDIYECNIYNQMQTGPRLLLNNGTGQFTMNVSHIPANIANLSNKYMASRFSDIDKDGDPDLILGANDNSAIAKDAILKNDGTGIFTIATNALPNRYGNSNWGTVAIAVADLNNDGYDDLLMSTLYQYQTCQIQILINKKDGTFSDSTKNIVQSWGTTNTWIKWIETADFNNDGWMDFVVCSFAGQPKLYLNGGNTKFVDASFLLADISNVSSYRARDFDNDGLTDIAFLQFSGNIIISKNIKAYKIPIDSSGVLTSSHNIKSEKLKLISSPNPFNTQTIVYTQEPLQNATLSMYNLFGQKVKEISHLVGQSITIFRDNLPAGLYSIQVTEKNEVMEMKVLIVD